MPKDENQRGARRTAARQALTIVVVVAGSLALSLYVGHRGAPKHSSFDWRLFAEAATAFGTVLLAGYTAWLATTTRQEVLLATDEQRARDRPVVIATPLLLATAVLDQSIQLKTLSVGVQLVNVGAGPAIDLRFHITYEGDIASEVEIIPVLRASDDGERREVPLHKDFALPGVEDYSFAGFDIVGNFTDRTQHERLPITVRPRSVGMELAQQDAARTAAATSALYASFSAPTSVTGQHLTYSVAVGNNGRADALDAVLQPIDEDGVAFGDAVSIGVVKGQASGGQFVTVIVTRPHPTLRCRLTWRDAIASREVTLDAWPASDRPFQGT